MIDDEEQEELRCTGSDVEIEEYTDTEESPYVGAYRASSDKLFDRSRATWQKFTFLITLLTVVTSVTVLVIGFPLYLESISAVSNSYTGLLFSALGSACILGFVYVVMEKVSPPPPLVPNSMRIRIPRCILIKISTLYALSVMSLQRIFASTTIIVGLFISVDYGLCDEFRCRGREVSAHTATMRGSWGVRAVWTFVYVGALAAFAMFFTMLERHYTTGQQNICQLLTTQPSSFLYTVSRLVSSRDIRRRGSEEEGGRLLHVTDPDPTIKPKNYPKPPILQTLFHIHAIAFFAILTLCWLDTLPGIGRGLSPVDLYRIVEHGLSCHFKAIDSCSNVSSHAWICLLAYVIFIISSINFLSMCESAVFTVAAATVSLPLSGIWWSIYKMNVGANGGFIEWSPGVTGELICALLGLPIVLLGLGLLVRSHFRDNQAYYQTIQPPDIQHEPPCHR
ncbi:uncharacterized protein LOC124949974 isoform X2 [Vespa velutina]|uniref:uncharacterized protein LOC124949974 isoform X2 n=1 Tax=Vespa velutina TaxID=202808 RepID=UPI001FB336D2|nr:uncharacterized protein LOC124949974 isoform X2 [Vespa velutina]